MINNPIGFEYLRATSAPGKELSEEVALLAYEYAQALMEKMKEERK